MTHSDLEQIAHWSYAMRKRKTIPTRDDMVLACNYIDEFIEEVERLRAESDVLRRSLDAFRIASLAGPSSAVGTP